MKNTLKVIFVIVGTLIGAGFASGKEVYSFFAQYDGNGIIGIFISSFILSVVIYKVLKISLKNNINTYNPFTKILIKSDKIREILEIIINIFLVISFFIMIAGFSAYLNQEFNIPNICGTIIISIVCYITFLGNIKMLVKINSILTPIIIIVIMALLCKSIPTTIEWEIDERIIRSIIKAVLYASYNSIILIPILLSLKEYINNEKQIKIIAIISYILVTILAITIFLLLQQIEIDAKKIEMPIIYIVGKFGKVYKYIYGIIILTAIYTSAGAAGYGILENYINSPKTYKRIAKMLCIIALFTSLIGFSNLVNLLYPAFGILGLFQIYKITISKMNN